MGRFSFSRATLQQVNTYMHDLVLRQVRYILIDEIGHLEMTGKGLTSSPEYVLALPPETPTSVILVVQEQALPVFWANYCPANYCPVKYKYINLDKLIPRCFYS